MATVTDGLWQFGGDRGGGRKDRVLDALGEAAKRLPKWSLGRGSKAFGGVSFLLPFSSHCSADLLAMPHFYLVRA